MLSIVPKRLEHRGGRLLAPARNARDPVGGVADEREKVGNGFGTNAELRLDTGLVEDGVARPIVTNDARPTHALSEILVRRRDEHALDLGVAVCARRERRERVVGLELDHRPRDEPERSRHALGERKLAEQIGIEPLPRLVTVEKTVPKRLDDRVERDRRMRHPPRAKPGGKASKEPAGRGGLDPARARATSEPQSRPERARRSRRSGGSA